MLAAPGGCRRADWAYEVKWDGFRAIVSIEGSLRGRSRRGWNMSEHVDFLEQLPVRAVFDGELVAFGAGNNPQLSVRVTSGTPSRPRTSPRTLLR